MRIAPEDPHETPLSKRGEHFDDWFAMSPIQRGMSFGSAVAIAAAITGVPVGVLLEVLFSVSFLAVVGVSALIWFVVLGFMMLFKADPPPAIWRDGK